MSGEFKYYHTVILPKFGDVKQYSLSEVEEWLRNWSFLSGTELSNILKSDIANGYMELESQHGDFKNYMLTEQGKNYIRFMRLL